MVGLFRWIDTTSQRNRDIVIICIGLLLVVFYSCFTNLGLLRRCFNFFAF
jgi:hypothetical protein